MQTHHMNFIIAGIGAIGIAFGGLLASPSRAFASPSCMQSPGDSGSSQSSGDTAPTAGGVTVQIEIPKDFGGAEGGVTDAIQAARDYLAKKNWVEGRNGPTDSGFFVVIASAPIVKSEPKAFDQNRRQAAKEAMYQAKKAMVKYLAAEVETTMRFKYVEGNPPLGEIASAATKAAPTQPGAIAKLSAILNYEIDQQLIERGIDPSLKSPEQQAEAAAAAKKIAKQLMAKTEFSDAVNIAAEHELSGLQAFRTFESVRASGVGTVAVVAVYSKKSADLQRALLGQTGTTAPKGAPSEPVSRWAASQGDDVLLYTHGVQVRTNETGELVLVGFGQSTPLSASSARMTDGAKKKAIEQADGELRRFMGELITVAERVAEASTLSEYADESSEFQSSSSYEEQVTARAAKLSTPGILKAYSWTKQHPQSDRETQGCVLVWSVSEMIAANDLRNLFKAAGGAAGGAGGSGLGRPTARQATGGEQKPRKPVGGSSSGSGAEGVDP
jgi:hypothetical protein